MIARRLFLASTMVALGTWAFAAEKSESTLTIACTGTLGPILGGSDPLGANGHTGSMTVKIGESATPLETSGDSVIYGIPAGAITASLGESPFTTTSPGKMKITLTPSADILTVVFYSQQNTITTFKAFLSPGSWPTSVYMTPLPFSPSPQMLTGATVAAGPGSEVIYKYGETTTILGLTGTASNSVAPALPIPLADLQ